MAERQGLGVVMLISDGWGADGQTLTRSVKRLIDGDEKLFLDELQIGSSLTHSTDSLVTDSAAGATCFSCGVKTYNNAIGVNGTHPGEAEWCGTVLEAAHALGMRTGLVATSRITHATPASYNAHVVHRDLEDDIAAQQIDLGMTDLMFGGGARHFDAATRADRRDLIGDAINNGYNFAVSKGEMDRIEELPALGLFASSHLSFELDRKYSVDEPSLLEMTSKALELLSADGGDFFLMVEGSRIDHASHGNDPVGHVFDGLMYDETARFVMEFAEQHGNMLIASTSDHETGGLSCGFGGPYEYFPEELLAVHATPEYLGEMFRDPSNNDPVQLIEHYTDYTLTQEEKDMITDSVADGQAMIDVAARLFSDRAKIGWTTGGHTGSNVPLFAAGTGPNATAFVADLMGGQQNNDIGVTVARYLGIELPITPYPWDGPATIESTSTPPSRSAHDDAHAENRFA